jgi:hypothetical protein
VGTEFPHRGRRNPTTVPVCPCAPVCITHSLTHSLTHSPCVSRLPPVSFYQYCTGGTGNSPGVFLPVPVTAPRNDKTNVRHTVRVQGGSSSWGRGRHVGACDASKSGMMITASLRSVSALQSGVLVTSCCQPLVRKAQAPG